MRRWEGMMGERFWLGGMAAICIAGCVAPRSQRVVGNPDPSGKIPAIETAVADKDQTSVGQLVKDLDSDDSAVRFYAAQGLRRLTGRSFGYRYYDSAERRAPAMGRWKAWLAEQNQAGEAK